MRRYKQPLMQKRHFEVIASIISDSRYHLSGIEADRMAYQFARRLRHTNPGFDEWKFLKACGVSVEYIKASNVQSFV